MDNGPRPRKQLNIVILNTTFCMDNLNLAYAQLVIIGLTIMYTNMVVLTKQEVTIKLNKPLELISPVIAHENTPALRGTPGISHENSSVGRTRQTNPKHTVVICLTKFLAPLQSHTA